MEVYAAMLDCVDQNFGRLVAFLESLGALDNTIVMFASDNGGTSAGGPIGAVYNNRRMSGLPDRPLDSWVMLERAQDIDHRLEDLRAFSKAMLLADPTP